MNRIPVLGLPILNKPDLMLRMLESVDYDVERLYIIDNGGVVSPDMVRGFRANNVHISNPGYNMGVGPAWNAIIKANIQAPWWLITSNDLTFSPGCLERLYDDMENNTGPHLSRIVIGNEDWGNHFGAFALNAAAIDLIGWFDENIQPIYYEDTEYIDRIEAAKGLGFTVSDVVSKTHHDGNASWKDSASLKVANSRTWDLNRDYRDEKRGTGEYHVPFGGDSRYQSEGLRYQPQTTVSRLREQDWHVKRKDNVKNDGHFTN